MSDGVYYSPSTGGFYTDAIHGAREISEPEPDWKPAEGQTEADRPTVQVLNPKTKVPDDAVAITQAQRAELMAQQATGMVIQAGPGGAPVAVSAPAPTVAHVTQRRDAILASTAWRVAPDEPDQSRSVWTVYRAAVRQVDVNTPAAIVWPATPAS